MWHNTKLAVISGASRGIGAAIARSLAEHQLGVVLLGRNKESLNQVADYLKAEAGTALAYPCDITRSKDVQKLANTIAQTGSKIELLINNAGISKTGLVEEFAYADWQDVINTNLNGSFLLTKTLLPFITDQRGQIVFINSVAGKQSFPEWSAYNASKAGLRAFADTLRAELSPRGIRVTSIYPAAVDTPIHDDLPYDWDRSKMMRASDIAEAVLYCYKQAPSVRINEIDLENSAGTF